MNGSMSMTDLAREYRLPLRTSPEDLEGGWSTVLEYENRKGQKRVLLAGRHYTSDGQRWNLCWIAAVYEFTDDSKTTCEDSIGLRELSAEHFSTNGNAIAWAIANAE